jgi:hypothetical protein
MEFYALAGEFGDGVTVIFLGVIPILFAISLLMGATALLLPEGGEEDAPVWLAAASASLLTVLCAAVGLYPGTAVDLLMREYGIPLDLPFDSWTALGWAVLICCVLAAVIVYAWTRRRGDAQKVERRTLKALPLVSPMRVFPHPPLENRRVRGAAVLSELLIYMMWIAAMVYLGIK